MGKSLSTVFHEMGLQVLAEGVENAQQEAFVKSCGIDYIQGFYFAKPLPEEEAFAFIRNAQAKQEMIRGIQS